MEHGESDGADRLRGVAKQRPTDDTEHQRLPAIGQGSSSSPFEDRREAGQHSCPSGRQSAPLVSSLKLASGE